MPNYIQLISLATDEPESFATVDEKLCATLAVPCDPVKYYCSWYDVLGYSGQSSIQDIITIVQEYPEDKALLSVLNWLSDNYTLNAWYSR